MKCAFCGNPLDESRSDCPTCGRPKTAPAPRDGDEVAIRAVRIDDLLLGRYRLDQKIGEGGMGTVYMAHDKELDRVVAVKLLSSSYVADKEVVERFEREARLTARLDHPNIVPVYDVGRHDGRPFIVMKKLEGQSLAGVLREKGGFTRDETLNLFRQLAAGIDFIHGQGFIHRDIKAGNIFVGSDGQATILDFGILRPARGKEALTRTGMVMGTPHYMAPEQALGSKNVDHRVDLYALAVVVFECLTGTLPFEADSELRIIQMQAHQPPPDLLERAPWIPKPVAEVMKKALSKQPEERFGSAAELVKALEASWSPSTPAALADTYVRKVGPPPQVSPSTSPSLRRVSDSSVAVTQPDERPVPVPTPIQVPPSTEELERAVRRSRVPVLVVGVLLLAVGAVTYALVAAPDPVKVVTPVPVDAGRHVAVPVEVVDAGLAAASSDAGDDAVVVVVDTADAGEEEEVDAGAVRQVKRLKPGQISVSTFLNKEPYWADLWIDGYLIGRTPRTVPIAVGSHRVKVERVGFKSELRVIRVASGQSSVVRIDLRQ